MNAMLPLGHTHWTLLSAAALCGWIFTEQQKKNRYRIWCNKMDIKEVSWSWQKRRKMPSSHQMVAKSLHTIIYDFRNSLLVHKCHSKRLKSRRCCYFLVFHRIMDIAVVVYSVCIKTILTMLSLSRMYISWLCHSHDIIVNASIISRLSLEWEICVWYFIQVCLMAKHTIFIS